MRADPAANSHVWLVMLSDMFVYVFLPYIHDIPGTETFLPSTVSSTSADRFALVAKVRAACCPAMEVVRRALWRGRERMRLDRIMLAAVLGGNSYNGRRRTLNVERFEVEDVVCNG